MRTNDGALEYALRVFRRRKLVIFVAIIAVPLGAFLYSQSQPKEYTASATLLFEPEAEAGVSEAPREAATSEALASLPTVAASAAKKLGNGTNINEVLGHVEISAANEMANLTTVSASSESPERAAQIANAYSQAYIDFRREADRAALRKNIAVMEARIAELTPAEAAGPKGGLLRERLNTLEVEEALQTGRTSLVQEATPPSSPSKPKTKRNVLIGLLIGVVLGLALAAIIERLDRHVRSIEELEEVFGLPIIARIPKSKNFKNASAQKLLHATESEAFRTLRTNIRYLNVNRELTTILIASPEPNDGKSTVARGLAGAMAEMGDSVVLVEADLHKDSAFRHGSGYVRDGLSGVLAGESLEASLMQIPISGSGANADRTLAVLPSGPIPPNPSELLESDRMREILAELSERFEYVIIDSPATGVVSDAMALVPQVSGILTVGGIGRTTREGAARFMEQLLLTGNRPLGLIATMVAARRSQYAYYRPSGALTRS
jgi:capsular exopolysaccharide synthesis family protein